MTGSAGGRPRAGGIVAAGTVAAVAVGGVLVRLTPMAAADAAYMAVLLVFLPALAIAQLAAVDDAPVQRMQAYGGSIVALILLTGATLVVGTRESGAGASVGLVSLPPGRLLAWSALLLGAGLALVFIFRAVALRMGFRESRLVRELIPETGSEKAAFAILSGWAGMGEELTYRGYAILALAPITGVAGAGVLTSVVFGVLHAYQGPFGMVRAGSIGGLFAWAFVATGSVWPGVVAHALLDVVAGLLLADRMMVHDDEGGVDELGRAPSPPDEATQRI